VRSAGLHGALEADGARIPLRRPPGSATAALCLALARRETAGPVVHVARTPEASEGLRDDLAALWEGGARHYPQREAQADLDLEGQRIETLGLLLAGRCGVIAATSRALIERCAVPAPIERSASDPKPGRTGGGELFLTLSVGSERRRDELAADLASMGYEPTGVICDTGDMAVRGGVVDVFPAGPRKPLRIELWGDEIHSIRRFDPLSQRSVELLDEVSILPVSLEAAPSGMTDRRCLLELLPPDAILVMDEEQSGDKLRERLWQDSGADAAKLVMPPAEYGPRLRAFRRLVMRTDAAPGEEPSLVDLGIEPPPDIGRDMKRLASAVRLATSQSQEMLFLCDNEGQLDRVEEILTERVGPGAADAAGLCIGSLSGGFRAQWPEPLTVLTDHEVFARARLRSRTRFRGAATLESVASLQPGDYVVHLDHGIGVYRGLELTEADGETFEALSIEYADGDLLRLPHYRVDLIERWNAPGTGGAPPRLHKIGGKRWKQTKRRAQRSIETAAAELLDLYARRTASAGRSFGPPGAWQREMESAFIHDETPDQLTAWRDVLGDLERPLPMDRLLCGDVGFGKTEVAMRAAFLAVQDGAQVAVLAPTTVLVDQHARIFSERMAQFPVVIESLSRFRTRAEQLRVLKRLADGSVDIVIGTHRLLSPDVRFKDLGLLVIDEEQRFGVRQKERLKELRARLDVLTMTATPIPRTLHMAMTGIRDLSLIRTPPRDRLPVTTRVLPWDDGFVEEALAREIDRGGQAFVVHDRVETLPLLERRIRELAGGATVAVAHGQMPERQLETAMRSFVNRESDILVCTSIIENGIDVPSANTLLVNRAHNFGLAQLYQLRGRIGRSHRKAFCALIVPEDVTPEAARRLRVLERHTELGVGHDVALRDLEMRGAGNLLGADQSGFAARVGVDTYRRMVEDTVRRIRSQAAGAGGIGDTDEATPGAPEVSVQGTAALPDDYVADAEQKMHLYRRLARAGTVQEITDLRTEMRDRFGRIPPEAERLLQAALIKATGTGIGVEWVRASDDEARITFAADAVPNLVPLGNSLADRQVDVEVVRLRPLSLRLSRGGGESLLPTVAEALRLLAGTEQHEEAA